LTGQPVAIHSSGVGVVLASAANNSKNAIGLATEDIAPTFSGVILVDGPLTLADWTNVIGSVTLATKATYWLSATAGLLTTSAPTTIGQIDQVVGKSVSTDTLEIKISESVLL
jgi:hypothetical protein